MSTQKEAEVQYPPPQPSEPAPSYAAPQQQSYAPQQGYAPQPGYVPQPGYQAQQGYVVQQGYPAQQAFATPQVYYQAQPAHGPIIVTNAVSPAGLQGNVPDDHCTFSVLTTIFCCFWIGVFAIIKSQSVRDSIARGDLQGAHRSSAEALRLNKIGLGVGIGINVVYIVCIAVYACFVAELFYSVGSSSDWDFYRTTTPYYWFG